MSGKMKIISILVFFLSVFIFQCCETTENDIFIPDVGYDEPVPEIPMIKVRLSHHNNISSVKVDITGTYKLFLTDENKDEVLLLGKPSQFTIETKKDGFSLKNSEMTTLQDITNKYFRIVPSSKSLTLTFDNNETLTVKGETVFAKPKPDRAGNFNPDIFDIIIRTDLETYCAQVLLNEMPASFHDEALKAQSIATRTYAWYKVIENQERKNFAWAYDLESSTADTVFDPSKLDQKAVDLCKSTFANVLTYKDNKGRSLLMIAYYHSTCGGATANVYDFEGKFRDIPPFQGAITGYCEISPMFSWVNKYSWKTWRDKLIKKKYATDETPETLKSIEISDKDKFGRAKELMFTFENAPSISIKAYQFRLQVAGAGKNELPSVFFKNIKINGDEIEIAGNGWGHGMGLCQFCAQGLALKGKGYREILSKFYISADIVRGY